MKPTGSVKFGDPGRPHEAETDTDTGEMTIKNRYRYDVLTRDEFKNLYWLLFHESMHSTDSPRTMKWNALRDRFGVDTTNHLSIYSRENNELIGISVSPIWGISQQ